jgi:hypothetical protein
MNTLWGDSGSTHRPVDDGPAKNEWRNGGSLLPQSTGTVASLVRFAAMDDGGEQ